MELAMMLSGASDRLAGIAFMVSNAKWMALTVAGRCCWGRCWPRSRNTGSGVSKAAKTGP